MVNTLLRFIPHLHDDNAAAMAPGNLLNWANSVRANMASDSGRETFQLQVKTQGFLFLDDYLQNILSGTKQE